MVSSECVCFFSSNYLNKPEFKTGTCEHDDVLFRDVSKFAMHFIVEEIDEDTSMEELQKMMLVALVYRMLVCFYEVSTGLLMICVM